MAELNMEDEINRAIAEANEALTDDTERIAKLSAVAARAVYEELLSLPEIDITTAKGQLIVNLTMHAFGVSMKTLTDKLHGDKPRPQITMLDQLLGGQ